MAGLPTAPAMPMDPAHPALAAEQRRAAALVAHDTAALADLLDPALRYVHAPGTCHDRAALLRFVAEGPRFLVVAFTPEQLSDLGGGAVLCGRLHLRLQRGDGPVVDAHSWATAVWRPGADGAWRLAVFQSTRQPEPTPGA